MDAVERLEELDDDREEFGLFRRFFLTAVGNRGVARGRARERTFDA